MLNWLRFLCLLLAGLALFTGWVWQERSKWVYAIDWHLTKFYEGDTAERIKELRKQMYGGELEFPVGIEELKEIQSENRHAVFGDRKFAFWRASTEVLSEALMETELASACLTTLCRASHTIW